MAYTKEQRAARAAANAAGDSVPMADAEQDEATPKADEVLMEKDGKTTEVRNNESVQIMQALGWMLKD